MKKYVRHKLFEDLPDEVGTFSPNPSSILIYGAVNFSEVRGPCTFIGLNFGDLQVLDQFDSARNNSGSRL